MSVCLRVEAELSGQRVDFCLLRLYSLENIIYVLVKESPTVCSGMRHKNTTIINRRFGMADKYIRYHIDIQAALLCSIALSVCAPMIICTDLGRLCWSLLK